MDFVNPPNQLYRMLDRIPHMRKSSSSNLPFGSLTELSMLKLCEDEYVPDTLPFLKLPALRKFSGINLIERSPIRDSDSVSEDEDFEENINEETIDEELAELRAEAAANGEGVQDQGFPLLNDNSGETGSESLGQSAEEDNDNQEDQPLESSRESSPDEDDEDNNWTGFSTVTHLHFRRSNSEINFSRHIRACAKLESFIFEFYNTFLCRQFYPKKLHKALYQHRGTLQELTIVEDEDNRGALDKPELMPSLSEFSALKSLRIRGEILCGRDAMVFPSLADRLPSSLESLYITETEDFNHLLFVDQLAGVASSAHTKFPCLKKVTLEDQSHKYEYRFSSIGVYRYLMPPRPLPSSLIEMCQKAGIEFRLVQVSDFPKLGRNFS
ncbi:hypothetical protein PHISCL_05131 [Aspergillus sclerotialis]|uniref:Leucine-rich repeat domain-containing protein n=1 Tax=Aspergillus sclerotialis TaxID=2070753 RepID=A0A3A2ZT92_9EURO|nr:hypothetical protein PHISCL_05131 [Aspergillus sclerotialis]